jgi:hypothetical protein
MVHYYTVAKIKEALRQAEAAGVTTLIGRADGHIIRTLIEYWDEGGKLQWVAQTCPGVGPTVKCVDMALEAGAKACFVHGGVMDVCYFNNDFDDPVRGIEKARAAGLPVGIAGHHPEVFQWAEENLEVDFYMCSYYTASHRRKQTEAQDSPDERFSDEDRQLMAGTIQKLNRPVIHYKVLAAGRNDPAEALAFVARTMRITDAVCVGVYTKLKPDMVTEDVRLFEEAWAREKGKR